MNSRSKLWDTWRITTPSAPFLSFFSAILFFLAKPYFQIKETLKGLAIQFSVKPLGGPSTTNKINKTKRLAHLARTWVTSRYLKLGKVVGCCHALLPLFLCVGLSRLRSGCDSCDSPFWLSFYCCAWTVAYWLLERFYQKATASH